MGVFYLPEDSSRAPDGICLAHNRPLLYVICCQPISGWDSPLRWSIKKINKKKYKINLVIRNIVLSLYCNQNINTMGQYFKAIVLGNEPKEGEQEVVKSWVYSHEYDNGLKLMEHSYQGNIYVSTFEKELTRRGTNYKSRVVWAGDYADVEPGVKIIQEGKEYDANLYSLCNDENEVKPKVGNTKDYPYILNHSKKLFVDKNKVPDIEHW